MLLAISLLLIAAAGVLLFFFQPASIPLAITLDAIQWDRQFQWTLWISGVIFVSAQILLAWTILRGRRKPSRAFAPQAHGALEWTWTGAALEWTWAGATTALFLTLAVFGSRGWAKVPVRAPGEETIEVHAHQFAWNFRYPGPDGRFGKTSIDLINDSAGNPLGIDPADPDGRDDIVTATLRVPAGRDVLLLLHSRDVIHDFFVRELRTKQDIVPGMEIPLQIHVERPGTWEIACAELCGTGHGQMRSFLIALPPEEYDRWKHQH